MREAYDLVLSKDLLSDWRQIQVCHADFPTLWAASDRDPKGAADDLVPEADAYYSYPILSEDLPHKVDELEDPGVVVEGAVL